MHPKLSKLQATLTRAIGDIAPEEMSWHPAGKWSPAEILEHLNLTYTGTIKNLERCLRGEKHASSDRSRTRWPRIVVTRLGIFPGGRKSPDPVRPRGTPLQQVLSEIMTNLARMDVLISECERKFPQGKPIADHPILGPLTAAEWRNFHLCHGRHHARQIAARRGPKNLLGH